MLENNGDNLSQGQRQLISIARVMLTSPAILILDEATSSIDTRTERKIQDAFSEMMVGRTSFIVAHRLSTVREADLILVMRDGKIVEKGRHEELLAMGGFYFELYNSQFAKEGVTVRSEIYLRFSTALNVDCPCAFTRLRERFLCTVIPACARNFPMRFHALTVNYQTLISTAFTVDFSPYI